MDIGLGKEHGSPGLAVEPGRAGVFLYPTLRLAPHFGDVFGGEKLDHSGPPSSSNRVMRSMTGSAIAALAPFVTVKDRLYLISDTIGHCLVVFNIPTVAAQKSAKIVRIVRDIRCPH